MNDKDDPGMVMTKMFLVACAVLLFAVLLAIPFTRNIIVYILPLGSGADDIIFGLVAFVFGILWFARQIRGFRYGKGVFFAIKNYVNWGIEDDKK